jgi:hypothetical protein
MMASIFWIFRMISFYYKYHYTDILFAFMYPDWVLIANVVLSLTNWYFGVKLIMNKITMPRSFLIMAMLIITGLLINNFYFILY